MSADVLLARLNRVKRTGPDRWIACCPGHDDKSPSLSIRELDDGRTLLHDFGGCDVESILAAIGLDWSAIMPERVTDYAKPERSPFNAHDVLACIANEALIVAITATHMNNGKTVSDPDRERVMQAAARIESARALIHDD